MNNKSNQSPPEKAKAQYTNGFAIKKALIKSKPKFSSYPIYTDDGDLIGFIQLIDHDKMPKQIEIRDRYYIKSNKITN